ncbi:hypothetical protein VF14_29235 [Nostoc linckia z18]|uniref:DUF4231 domain-containing protein n=2 Tax=Nostoc linckia TaxID=92942 RepID=A0A9Q5Z5U2_NOSLI|nr:MULTISPECIES: DUF4231 domain-containing protein [Nostoc]PHK31549.1 hypothetical protein VF12_27845 [Nostoc linckia z15]PHK43012.1 hypothetical protein VF13_28655 [Nostoc linckia z16]MBC1241787.1 DUF4231 domain-containing protein [Nostoc sp. 2RC]PHJ57543.1 hypothetical protein VF02_29905 [Nostoc linckia z1]PHJ59747.1 hypothetical protein VF05_31595 [Nostoc linckia z3]
MTTSELTNFENKNQSQISDTFQNLSSSTEEKKLFTFKVIEYLLLAIFVSSILFINFYSTDKTVVIYGTISLTVLFFLLLINRQVFQDSKKSVEKSELARKAELYTYLLANNTSWSQNTLSLARKKALQYSQDLIDDYKRVKTVSRNLYYILQIATVILSGVTPILVLVDKLESGQPWLKWLPVLCPALASILASIVTSFPFQKNSIAANTAVELLEAEQEKFILGVTQPYRCYDVADEIQQQQKASQALEYFIVQVNNIHLNQVQQASETQADKTESTSSNESSKESANETIK